MPATALAALILAAGCAEHLMVEIDRPSFAGAQSAPAELDRWRDNSAKTFKAAASALCNDKRLKGAELAGMKRLLIQYGGGADSAAVWVDDARPDTVILQYAFYPGAPAPDAQDVRDAIICWAAWDDALCEQRLP